MEVVLHRILFKAYVLAWYVFDQVNSNTIDDSLNIGSITDRGTGSMYDVFTNNMNSLHYTNPSIVAPAAY